MPKQTILESEYATLWYHPEQNVVHHRFHKFIYGEEFRRVLETGLEVFKKHNAQKWLSDDQSNSALPAEDMEWGVNNWAPRVISAGWKYWAIVMPDKVAGKLTMKRLIDLYAERGVTIQIFEDSDEALKWLANPQVEMN